jgi:hypothetical protein
MDVVVVERGDLQDLRIGSRQVVEEPVERQGGGLVPEQDRGPIARSQPTDHSHGMGLWTVARQVGSEDRDLEDMSAVVATVIDIAVGACPPLVRHAVGEVQVGLDRDRTGVPLDHRIDAVEVRMQDVLESHPDQPRRVKTRKLIALSRKWYGRVSLST